MGILVLLFVGVPTLAVERAVLMPTETSASLRPMAVGVDQWLATELLKRRLRVGTLAAAKRDGVEPTTLRTQLIANDGQLRVSVSLWSKPSGGELLALGRAESRVDELGKSLAASLTSVLSSWSAAGTKPVHEPRPSDLAAYARSTSRIQAGRLHAAVSEIAGIDSPTATRLRESIQHRAADPKTPVTERSKVASALGVRDESWFKIRQGLTKGRQPEYLVAALTAAMAREDREHALKLAQEVTSADPSQPDALRAKALLLAQEKGKSKEAVAAATAALAVSPDDPALLEALAQNPTLSQLDRRMRWEQLGSAEAKRFASSDALAAWTKAGGASGSTQAGSYLLQLGRDKDAKAAFEKAVALEPEDADAWTGLGDASRRGADSAGAEKAYRKALALNPEKPEALSGLGKTLVDAGRAEEAVEPLERAVSLEPSDATNRRALSRAHRERGQAGLALAVLDPTEVEPVARASMMVDAAALHREAGRIDEAEDQLKDAIAFDATDLVAREALVDLYQESGNADGLASEQEFLDRVTRIEPTSELTRAGPAHFLREPGPLDSLLESFGTSHPDTRQPIERVAFLGLMRETDWKLRALDVMKPRRVDRPWLDRDIEASVKGRFEVVPVPATTTDPVVAAVRQFSTDRVDIATVNQLLGVDAVVVARIKPPRKDGPPILELRMLVGTDVKRLDDVAILANRQPLAPPLPYVVWNPIAASPLLIVLAIVGAFAWRGWGTLQVDIDWDSDPKKKGFFHIQLSRKPGRAQKADRSRRDQTTKGYSRKAAYSRFKRSMVERRTVFRWLPARDTYVCVYGLMQDVNSGDVIGNFLEEKFVKLEKGTRTQISFELRKLEAAVRVLLHRPEESPDVKVVVGFRGAGVPVRFVREQDTVVPLSKGVYTLACGFDDRAFELPVHVNDLGLMTVSMQLGNASAAVFTDCPEAVEPFVSGELARAAELLAEAGQQEVADRIRADHLREIGEVDEAARLYEAVGDIGMAAETSAQGSDAGQSASYFAEAGEFEKAAEAYAAAGDMAKAAEAYEANYDYDRAIDAYKSAENSAKVLDLLEKTGRCFEAAVLAEEEGDTDRAIRNLQQVDLRDPDYLDATGRLATIFAEREEWTFAVEKLQEAINVSGEDSAPMNLLERLGDYQENAGLDEEALATFEKILRRDFTYPGMEDRVQALRTEVGLNTTVDEASLSSAATKAHSGRAIDERYELLGELGRGGMGVVFKARDKRLGRLVALKKLPDNLRDHPTAIQLFLREARSAAALNHPNIVTLFDADETDDNYYITMELLEGSPLDAILKQRGRLRPQDVARLGVQIATGLHYAHSNKIIHRDIKTSNLFFTNERVVKIMDFGLAKMVEEVRRAATVIGGTPFYMAPEQSAGEAVDHRADLYALGVTLFELVTGGVPFRDGDVAYHHRHTPAPDARERVPEIPAPMAELIAELMAKDPADRPGDTADVAARLQQMI